MQSQEDEAAITEQDLELIKERETAIRQLEVRGRVWLLFGLGICRCLEIYCWISMKRAGLTLCVLYIIRIDPVSALGETSSWAVCLPHVPQAAVL